MAKKKRKNKSPRLRTPGFTMGPKDVVGSLYDKLFAEFGGDQSLDVVLTFPFGWARFFVEECNERYYARFVTYDGENRAGSPHLDRGEATRATWEAIKSCLSGVVRAWSEYGGDIAVVAKRGIDAS